MPGNGGERLLALLQVANSSFPTGCVQPFLRLRDLDPRRRHQDARASAERRCRDWLRFGVATGDGSLSSTPSARRSTPTWTALVFAQHAGRRPEARPRIRSASHQDRRGVARRLSRHVPARDDHSPRRDDEGRARRAGITRPFTASRPRTSASPSGRRSRATCGAASPTSSRSSRGSCRSARSTCRRSSPRPLR